LIAALLFVPRPAHATSKEIIELQTQVQQLLDMVQRMQSTLDTRFGVIQHLVEQDTDNVNRMSALVTAMQQKMNADSDASTGKTDALSGQVQSVNDSLDELKSRIGKVDKQLQDIQAQLQTMQAPQQPAGAAGSAAPGSPTDAGQPGGAPAAAPQVPPLQDTYQGALRDYNAAHYDIASSEFGDVIHYYPQEDLAGNAQFYLGEIAYHQGKFKDAIKQYNAVIENFSGNPKAPAAQLRKGFALLALGQKEPGVHELRSLIQRYPQSPEAAQARTKLNGLGVRITQR
jgi:tol-pal system protein YbgF